MQDSKAFAKVLKTTPFKLYSKLNNPDHHFVIHTSPVKDEMEDYYHRHPLDLKWDLASISMLPSLRRWLSF